MLVNLLHPSPAETEIRIILRDRRSAVCSYIDHMLVHVCDDNGQPIGQYDENDFRDHLFAGRFPADSYYWHDGMEDWQPIAAYRALAKTQRISFAPPMRRTVKINIEDSAAAASPAKSGAKAFFDRLFRRNR